MNNKDWKKWLFWLTFAIVVIVIYKTIDSVTIIINGLKNLLGILMPFLFAVIVSYILYIPCTKFENLILKSKLNIVKKHARGLSVFIVYIIVSCLIVLIFNVVIPRVSTSVIDLASNIPSYYNNAINYLNELDEEAWLTKLNVKYYVKMLQENNIESKILEWINLDNIHIYIKGIVGVTNTVFNVFVTFVVSIYMLLERNDIKSFLQNLSKALFDKKTVETISRYYKKTNGIFFSFLTSQIIDAVIVGIITSIAMLIMNVKYAVLLGTLIGIFNIIPYFGAIIAVCIAVLITIFTGGFMQALWVALVIVILQQIDANVINPRILGDSLDLSPILVIFAVTIGGTYFGILGMFFGVPVVAFLKVIITDFITYKIDKNGILSKLF